VPVTAHSYAHFNPLAGQPPAAPTAVTSITRDAAATVSFLPGAPGDGAVTSWVVTPYIGGAAQSPQAVPVASATAITGSTGSTYTQVPVTGLANGTAYTFTVHGVSSYGDGADSAASGANTPLAGLVFGDDFGGPASGPIDPEWWVYTRCGYLAQSEVQYYLPDHCVLDGASNLLLIAEKTAYSGPGYPSGGGGTVNQPWRSGACQSNTKTWTPAAGNTMTFESKFQICPDVGNGMWPGLFWLNGQTALNAWKTDPAQANWNTTDAAEIDVAEFRTGGVTGYLNNVAVSSFVTHTVTSATDFSAAQHVFTCQWKPGASVRWLRDGTQTNLDSSNVPAAGCSMVLLLYLQILAGSATATQHCTIDYVRVYDQNLG
jgi:Fibronectin type III domain